LKATNSAFATSFGQANITEWLKELSEQPEFTALEQWRNILAHRLAGSTVLRDGTDESTRDERWYMPGPDQKLTFSEEMLRRQLQAITALLVPLAAASRQFAENQSSVN
jgi:hypothetical protein